MNIRSSRSARIRTAAWQAQWTICITPPVCLWGVPADPRYAAAQTVHHSQGLYEALTALDAAPIPNELRVEVQKAITAVGKLRSLRLSWTEHRDRCQTSDPPGTVPLADRGTYRQMNAEFPQPSTTATWARGGEAEQAMIEALPVLDRLQQMLAVHTGHSFRLGQLPAPGDDR